MDIASAATVRSSALLPQKTPSATVSTRPWTKTPDQFLHFRLPRCSWRLPLTGSSLPPRPHPRAAEDPSGPCSLAPLSQPGSSSLGLTRARAHSRLLALATPAVRASSGRPAVGAIPPGRPLTAALTTPPVDTLRTLVRTDQRARSHRRGPIRPRNRSGCPLCARQISPRATPLTKAVVNKRLISLVSTPKCDRT
jgi:hypothetical protein